MAYHHIRECRFCKAHSNSLLKYGTRHYAHERCFLDAGHKLSELHPWQVAAFAYSVLKDYGLLEEAEVIIRREQARQRAAGCKVILGEEPLP
jgi:hypothetical protein